MGYVKTLFTGATGMAVAAHFIEDISLLSIGRFAPLPWWGAFAIGIGFSWLVMGAIIYKIQHQLGGHMCQRCGCGKPHKG